MNFGATYTYASSLQEWVSWARAFLFYNKNVLHCINSQVLHKNKKNSTSSQYYNSLVSPVTMVTAGFNEAPSNIMTTNNDAGHFLNGMLGKNLKAYWFKSWVQGHIGQKFLT